MTVNDIKRLLEEQQYIEENEPVTHSTELTQEQIKVLKDDIESLKVSNYEGRALDDVMLDMRKLVNG